MKIATKRLRIYCNRQEICVIIIIDIDFSLKGVIYLYIKKNIRILGIDPGYAIVGFGILDYDGFRFTPVEYGAITTDAGMDFSRRLRAIHEDTEFIFEKFKPDCLAIERLYFTTNQKTAIDVAQARGIVLLSSAMRNIPVSEYTPLQVKQSVVGYGKAEKRQVMEMTRQILGLANIPKPDDAADALAIAICHGHTIRFG